MKAIPPTRTPQGEEVEEEPDVAEEPVEEVVEGVVKRYLLGFVDKLARCFCSSCCNKSEGNY